jgi:hypothetical protein
MQQAPQVPVAGHNAGEFVHAVNACLSLLSRACIARVGWFSSNQVGTC